MRILSIFILFFSITSSSASFKDILDRGHLICGVSNGVLGFSMPNEKGEWSGLDIDFCRALSLTIFGEKEKIKFVPLNAKERFLKLKNKSIDVLARNTSMTMERSTLMDFHFSPIIFHDGQSFMSHKKGQLKLLLKGRICLVEGASAKRNLEDYFKEKKVSFRPLMFPTHDEAALAFRKKRCSLLSMDSSALASLRLKMNMNKNWWIHKQLISHEPLALVVREKDKKLKKIVDWLVYGLIAAEEMNIKISNVDSLKKYSNSSKVRRVLGQISGLGDSLGIRNLWLYDVIKKYGNYGEIYNRNLSKLKLNRGKNNLWKNGGLLHSMPLR